MKELLTAHEKLNDLPRDIVGLLIPTSCSFLRGASEMIRCQLAEAMVEFELWDHQEALLNGHLFHILTRRGLPSARSLSNSHSLSLSQK